MAFKALPVAEPVAGAVVDSISLGARLVGPVINCGIPVEPGNGIPLKEVTSPIRDGWSQLPGVDG
jgi:hypothetical protein